ncbi:MAG: tetratricopeptide repeat protein, partial [Firmicutes bacterium]|nr:tetratricopeptide repeat protein [Bacillota bacterium]
EDATIIRVRFQTANHHVGFYAIDRIIMEMNARFGLDSSDKELGLNDNSDLYYLHALNRIFSFAKQTRNKTVLILENLESADNDSIDLIVHYFFEAQSRDIFTVGEYSFQFADSKRSYTLFSMTPGVKLIETHPLSRSEAGKFICDTNGIPALSDRISSMAMEYTGGNLMLLSDFALNFKNGSDDLMTITPETQMEFERILTSMSQKEISYYEFLSIMDRGAEFDMIRSVMDDTPLAALETVEKLANRHLIQQIKTEERMLLFIPEKMIRNSIQSRMLEIKAVELHRLAAEYSEKRFTENNTEYFYLTKAKYHYSFTNDTYKKIHYNILFLETGLDYFDEFFPTVFSEEQKRLGMDVRREEILRNIEEYEAELLAMEGSIPYNQFYELKCRLDFLHGRTLTRDGKREQGQKYIYDVENLAKECGLDDILMKAYVETLCFALKTENAELKEEYLALRNQVPNHEKYEKENAVILRIEGYFAIRDRAFEKAEELLFKSMEIFDQPKLRRSNYFNIAACYDYLSDNSREQGKYDEALDYLNKAIKICLDKNERKSLDLFYEDYGYILFLQGDYDGAYRYFEESVKLYDEYRTYWLRSIAESCMAMICHQRGQDDQAVEHFRLAEIFSKKDRSSEELRVLETARREMKKAKLI